MKLSNQTFFLGQREEGKIQGQLNNSDSTQYIRELKDQIAELNHEVSTKLPFLYINPSFQYFEVAELFLLILHNIYIYVCINLMWYIFPFQL